MSENFDNPYSPPLAKSPKTRSPFSFGYWVALTMVIVASNLLIFVVPLLGVLLTGSSIFALLRSIAFDRVIAKHHLTTEASKVASSNWPFFATSILIGFLATIASSIAFVAICFPAGMTIFSVNTGGSNETTLILLAGLALLMAIGGGCAVGVFVIRSSLPRVRSPQPLSSSAGIESPARSPMAHSSPADDVPPTNEYSDDSI